MRPCDMMSNKRRADKIREFAVHSVCRSVAAEYPSYVLALLLLLLLMHCSRSRSVAFIPTADCGE